MISAVQEKGKNNQGSSLLHRKPFGAKRNTIFISGDVILINRRPSALPIQVYERSYAVRRLRWESQLMLQSG